MRVKLVYYRKYDNEYDCLINDKTVLHKIDPFVSNALPLTQEDYENNKGYEFVGNVYEVSDDVFVTPKTKIIVPTAAEMVLQHFNPETIRMTIDLKIDPDVVNYTNEEEWKEFCNRVLLDENNEGLYLLSNSVGDIIGKVTTVYLNE